MITPRTACVVSFLSYLVFLYLFFSNKRAANLLKSDVPEMMRAYKEAMRRRHAYSQFVFSVLLIFQVCFTTSLWGFIMAGLGVVVFICTGSEHGKADVLHRLHDVARRVYDGLLGLYEAVHRALRPGETNDLVPEP